MENVYYYDNYNADLLGIHSYSIFVVTHISQYQGVKITYIPLQLLILGG